MSEIAHHQIPTNGIELHVAESGPPSGPPIVLCHGFPELWYSWRHQFDALAGAGFRVLAPDLRGYGGSSHPKGDVADYGADRIGADLCGLLDHFGYGQAAFSGHDWGAMILWELARTHPERMSSLCNMSVPFLQSPAPPIDIFNAIFVGKFFYMLYFQPVGPAEKELEADPRHFLRNMLWAASADALSAGSLTLDLPAEGTGFLDALAEAPDKLPSWITEEDVTVYGDAFAANGLFGPLSFYRNIDANWHRTHDIPASVLTMPTGFISGSADPVIAMTPGALDEMAAALPDFRGSTLIEGAGHWVQQEKPEETNDALLAFLNSVS